MSQLKELNIPVSILESRTELGSFALLRFFVEFFGKENARVIFSLLAQEPTEDDIAFANQEIFNALKEQFPYFANLSDYEIKMIIIDMYHKANQIIESLLETSFPGMEYELGLLNTTSVPTTNLAKRLISIMGNGESTGRYKYELLRQDILALMLLELTKYNHTVSNSENLNSLQNLFEEELYQGRVGELEPVAIFSVHTDEDNACYATFNSRHEAEEYIKTYAMNDFAHIKNHKWRVRTVEEIGPVLANMRTKSDFSIIRKIVTNSIDREAVRPKIEMGKDRDLRDTTGFMFVVPVGERETMMELILSKVRKRFPDVGFVEKSKVKSNRGQSDKVSFLRVLAYIGKGNNPIEIMVMDQVEYMNYRFELEQAHELFNLRKSAVSAELFFPQPVYHYDPEQVQEQRRESEKQIREKLVFYGLTE